MLNIPTGFSLVPEKDSLLLLQEKRFKTSRGLQYKQHLPKLE